MYWERAGLISFEILIALIFGLTSLTNLKTVRQSYVFRDRHSINFFCNRPILIFWNIWILIKPVTIQYALNRWLRWSYEGLHGCKINGYQLLSKHTIFFERYVARTWTLYFNKICLHYKEQLCLYITFIHS